MINALASSTVTKPHHSITSYNTHAYTELRTSYEKEHQLQWCMMKPKGHPCFTPNLLQELNELHQHLKQHKNTLTTSPVRYQVLASDIHNVYNLGGDLALFQQLIRSKNKPMLQDYAYACISAIYHSLTMHQHGITQISLIQGDALGEVLNAPCPPML